MTNKKAENIIVGMIETNCWIYPCDGEAEKTGGAKACIVIDPGDEAWMIISRLKELNMFPEYILLSHGHFDHLAALPDLMEAFRNGAFSPCPIPKICIHRLDAAYLGEASLKVHHNSFISAGGDPSLIDAMWKGLPEADILLEEGDSAGPLKVMHVPGHSPGSAAFYDEENDILFSGDTLFRGTWGRTDLPGGSDEKIIASLRRILSMKADTKVCPGHGPLTFVKNETGLIRTL